MLNFQQHIKDDSSSEKPYDYKIDGVDTESTGIEATDENIQKFIVFKQMVKELSKIDIDYTVINEEIHSTHLGEEIRDIDRYLLYSENIKESEITEFITKIVCHICGTYFPYDEKLCHQGEIIFSVESIEPFDQIYIKITNKETKKFIKIDFLNYYFDYGVENFVYDYSDAPDFKMNKWMCNFLECIFVKNYELVNEFIKKLILSFGDLRLNDILDKIKKDKVIILDTFYTIDIEEKYIIFTLLSDISDKIKKIVVYNPKNNTIINDYIDFIYNTWKSKYEKKLEIIKKDKLQTIEKLQKELENIVVYNPKNNTIINDYIDFIYNTWKSKYEKKLEIIKKDKLQTIEKLQKELENIDKISENKMQEKKEQFDKIKRSN